MLSVSMELNILMSHVIKIIHEIAPRAEVAVLTGVESVQHADDDTLLFFWNCLTLVHHGG